MQSPLAILLAASLLLTGCATQTKEQLAEVRSSGVSPTLVRKLERWGSLSPEDIIELKRRHVNDAVALRQLDRVGVDFVVDKDILKKLRTAGVSVTVITAVITASRRFEEQFQHPYDSAWHGPWGYPYDAFYYGGGWPYPRPYPFPGPGAGPRPAPGVPPPPPRP